MKEFVYIVRLVQNIQVFRINEQYKKIIGPRNQPEVYGNCTLGGLPLADQASR